MTSQRNKLELLNRSLFFKSMDPVILSKIAGIAEKQTFEAGDMIIKKGDPADGMYIVQSGRVKVHSGELTVAEIGANEVFGDMAMLDSSPRSMSISALKKTVLFFFNKVAFQKILGDAIQNTSGFVKVLLQRIKSDNDRTIEEFEKREKELTELVNKRTEELETRNEELLIAQKFKEQFLANMSHEIRTPMNAVVGMTNLLLHSDLNPEQSEFLEAIKQSSDNLLVIINDILDFSKIEAGKLEIESIDFSLSKVLEGLVRTMNFKVEEKGLSLELHVDDRIPDKLVGDPVRLNQILINLTGNAVKFTSDGTITIRCKLLEKVDNKLHLLFEVADTGIGIAEDKIDHIFESFSQAEGDTTRKFGGTGLGLTISKQLVELQGGTIGATSTPGKGSTFFFELEYPESENRDLVEVEDISEKEKLSHLTILLADDDDYNQIVGKKTLEMLIREVKVEVVENGKLALNKAREKTYDLILMDVNMPEMSGLEATEKIRKLPVPNCDVKIMAMTASATKNEVDRCMNAGMDDFISKPFKPEDLYQKIEGMVHRKENTDG